MPIVTFSITYRSQMLAGVIGAIFSRAVRVESDGPLSSSLPVLTCLCSCRQVEGLDHQSQVHPLCHGPSLLILVHLEADSDGFIMSSSFLIRVGFLYPFPSCEVARSATEKTASSCAHCHQIRSFTADI